MTTFADPSTFPSVFEVPAESGETPRTDAIEAAQETPAAVEVELAETAVVPTFAELGLPAELVRVLSREGINTPFEIQAATMPDALAGRDVLGRGQTGSGKTLAFGLPLLARVAQGGRALPHQPKALILVPTRELAMQVADALMPLGRSVGVFLKTAVGGVPYDRQMDALRRGVEVIVATPGRLGDLIERGACKLDAVEVTVLDEADQMADMGFLPEVTELLSKTPADAQRLLFSATLDGDVDALVKRFMNDPVTHSTAPAEASVSTMEHHMLLIPPHDKFPITASIANREGKTIVFARTQMGVDRLVDQLAAVGVRAGALHGGKTQRVRTRTLAEFKEGRTNVLVATDVAARGIHVDGISLVMHVDPPKDPKDYLHRAGRTARAGESGAVVTLVLPKQRRTTASMMLKAGVTPAELRVRLGDEQLAKVTGAREPSGVPVRIEPEPRERGDRPRRFGDRPQRGGYGDRPRTGGYGDRPQRTGEQRSFGDRPRSSFGGGERSYGDRPRGGDQRSFGDRPARSYGDRPTGDRAYSDRPTGDRGYGDRPTGGGDRSYGDRPAGGGDRSYGDRPAGGGDRSYGDRPTGGGGRPTGGGDQRSFGDRPARNYGERPGGFRREGGRNDRYSTGRPAHTH
ncbi:DEAD/DEAH box helicase [Amorphoplanes digitatis]|uniref:Superfamily II DNA/RNA helicase n=1 Tax=Actinoplanes digitatis TaxID=1868 RepID=A0A7W7I5U4_9ACTN|nr:DEAD/DEAH box helicase [Actinoplanes digitatis]MBB4767022.1 superfamily II DNA/RNA helicase [Actinoplanes digitatis]GID95613.1 RNA helicase [Actinoplanes digitatis]